MDSTQKIRTFLWFEHNAEEAARHYVSLFKNARILEEVRSGDAGPGPKGSILTIGFELEGQQFVALNGGPHHKFNDAISIAVTCETQAEIDELWNKLTADGGAEVQCGWLKDKYGLSWQIVPSALPRLLYHPEATKAAKVMQAMLQMKKLDIALLEEAAR